MNQKEEECWIFKVDRIIEDMKRAEEGDSNARVRVKMMKKELTPGGHALLLFKTGAFDDLKKATQQSM